MRSLDGATGQTRKLRAIGIGEGLWHARHSSSLARFGRVEACSVGFVNASFIALKRLLGLRTGKQTNRFAVANSAGKSFSLRNIKCGPGGVQVVGTTVAPHRLCGTSRQQNHSEHKQA